MNNTTLILSGDGYNLTIDPAAEIRKAAMLAASGVIIEVNDNDESANAAFHLRSMASVRIAVDKARTEIKAPVLRISKLIDSTAKCYLAEIEGEESRLKKLIGDHAERVAEVKAEALRKEREAFEFARAAREAAEETGRIADVIASKKALAERMAASTEVATTNIAQGVRFAWDFEVTDMKLLASIKPDFVEMTERRAVILSWIKALDAGEVEDVDLHCFAAGIRAFKKPVVSTR